MKLPYVLVLDSDNDICLLLKQIFQNIHIPCETVNTIVAAKRLISMKAPAHIFIERKLADGSGCEFASSLAECYPGMKITISTGNFEELDEDGCIDTTFEVLRKPFTREDVEQVVFNYA